MNASTAATLTVAVRARPLVRAEIAKGGRRDIIRVLDGRVVLVLDPDDTKVRVGVRCGVQGGADREGAGTGGRQGGRGQTLNSWLRDTAGRSNTAYMAFGKTEDTMLKVEQRGIGVGKRGGRPAPGVVAQHWVPGGLWALTPPLCNAAAHRTTWTRCRTEPRRSATHSMWHSAQT